ncbi:MAG: hypothetical protein VKM17_11125 [Cyanobacteriota bacterium]|nr:hypothetical protein [Cyanobacteriota bacterium]
MAVLTLRHSWRRALLGGLCGLSLGPAQVVGSLPARSQVADVVHPDPQGDFPSLRLVGPRGQYGQRFWLVVDRDPRGLWCRDGQGRPLIALRRGAVLETDETDPVILRLGKAYLRVRVKPVDVLYDARLKDRGTATICEVRANSSFLAPIHPDSLERVLKRNPE